MFTVTFYSYKGGVGRTLALANAAYLLATDKEDPCRVLLWDFDLEAPGLQQIFKTNSIHKTGGFVDMVTNYLEKAELPDVPNYIIKTDHANLDLLPAGRIGSEYSEKLDKIGWQGLYRDYHGWDFIENIKASMVSLEYDYLLIDSRTGYSDVGGICTQQLPDLVILMFRLNEQNIEGSSQVYKAISAWSDQNKQPVDVLPVISPVWPFGVEQEQKEVNDLIRRVSNSFTEKDSAKQRRLLRRPGKIPFLSLSFDSSLTFGERVLSRERDRFAIMPRICDEYNQLTHEIRLKNQNDPVSIRRQAQRASREDEFAKAFELFSRLVARRPHDINEWINLLRIVRSAPAYPQGKIQKNNFENSDQRLRSRLEEFMQDHSGILNATGCIEFVRGELSVEEYDIPRAVKHYSTAIEKISDPIIPLRARARLYIQLEDFDKAIDDLSKGIDLLCKSPGNTLQSEDSQHLFELTALRNLRALAFFKSKKYNDFLDETNVIKNSYHSELDDANIIMRIHAFAALEQTKESLEEALEYRRVIENADDYQKLNMLLNVAEAFISIRELHYAAETIAEVKILSPKSEYSEVLADMLLLLVKCLSSTKVDSLKDEIGVIEKRGLDLNRPLSWDFIELKEFISREKTLEDFTKQQIRNASKVINTLEASWKITLSTTITK